MSTHHAPTTNDWAPALDLLDFDPFPMFDRVPTFEHGVASGDPTLHEVVIWTRVSGMVGDPVQVRWVVANDRRLQDVVACGTSWAMADGDWTVNVDVHGLHSGRTYFYGFMCRGRRSPIGRTRTLPKVDAEQLRFAYVSCAKFNAGFFNAYARIAERDDLDFVLHLGDYIYEMANTPPKNQTPGADIGRPFEPRTECVTLDDYRNRYAQYHRDPDVQAMHAAHPMIATLDDHELADGAWRDGSDNHDEERDGPWSGRRATAFRARWEWLPARRPDPADDERVFRSVRVGNLAEIFLLDFRSRRDQPEFGVGMYDESRSALGAEQKSWFVDGLARSDSQWNIIGNPSPFASTWVPDQSPEMQKALRALKFMHATEDTYDEDQWDGYPAERAELLRAIADTSAGRALVLAGDLHASMAVEHTHPDDPWMNVVVEAVTPSITSQNLDEKLHLTPRTDALAIESDFVEALPGLRWCELESHGYVVVDVTHERINLQWWFVDTVLERSSLELPGQELVVQHGDARIKEMAYLA